MRELIAFAADVLRNYGIYLSFTLKLEIVLEKTIFISIELIQN